MDDARTISFSNDVSEKKMRAMNSKSKKDKSVVGRTPSLFLSPTVHSSIQKNRWLELLVSPLFLPHLKRSLFFSLLNVAFLFGSSSWMEYLYLSFFQTSRDRRVTRHKMSVAAAQLLCIVFNRRESGEDECQSGMKGSEICLYKRYGKERDRQGTRTGKCSESSDTISHSASGGNVFLQFLRGMGSSHVKYFESCLVRILDACLQNGKERAAKKKVTMMAEKSVRKMNGRSYHGREENLQSPSAAKIEKRGRENEGIKSLWVEEPERKQEGGEVCETEENEVGDEVKMKVDKRDREEILLESPRSTLMNGRGVGNVLGVGGGEEGSKKRDDEDWNDWMRSRDETESKQEKICKDTDYGGAGKMQCEMMMIAWYMLYYNKTFCASFVEREEVLEFVRVLMQILHDKRESEEEEDVSMVYLAAFALVRMR